MRRISNETTIYQIVTVLGMFYLLLFPVLTAMYYKQWTAATGGSKSSSARLDTVTGWKWLGALRWRRIKQFVQDQVQISRNSISPVKWFQMYVAEHVFVVVTILLLHMFCPFVCRFETWHADGDNRVRHCLTFSDVSKTCTECAQRFMHSVSCLW